jgi:hypothetical protein
MNALVKVTAKQALAIFDAPFGPSATAAIAFARTLTGGRVYYASPGRVIDARYGTPGRLQMASERRGELIGRLARADAAQVILSGLLMWQIDEPTAVEMVSALYARLGMKCKPDMLKGAIEVLTSDALGNATGLWRSVHVTPAVLALACRKLMAQQKFELKPVELLEACREARTCLVSAHSNAQDYCDNFVEVDAILLAHAREQWAEPYQDKPELQLRVLELHECTDNYWDGPQDDVETPGPFQLLVDREKAKVHAAIELAKPPAIAACKQTPAKRTHEPG